MNDLESFGLNWLRFEKRCPVVLWERSPRQHQCGRPDLLGVTKDRQLIEIEVKRSMSDFRNNQEKRCMKWRETGKFYDRLPRQFYFLVSHNIADKVLGELPEWAGLMRGPGPMDIQQLVVVKRAPLNQYATKLSTRECVEVAHLMANQVCSVASENTNLRRLLDDHNNHLPQPESEGVKGV